MKRKIKSLKKQVIYFFKEKTLIWMSFLIVCSVTFSVKYSGDIQFYYSQRLENKVLTALYDEEKYLVEGLPKMVDIVLEGKEAQVKNAVAKNEVTANVDLSNLGVGQHIVPIEIQSVPKNVIAESNPVNVSILIKPKVSQEREVQIDYINQENKDKRVELGEPVLSQNTVTITGAKDMVEKVVSVKAIVDVSNTDQLNEYQAQVYAMSEDGTRLDLQIEPSFIEVSISHDMPSKVVPFKATIEGVPSEKAIESIQLSEEELTIYAPKHILSSITDVKVNIPYEKLNEAGEVNVEITPPTTVTEYSVTKLGIKAVIVNKASVVLLNVPVELRNVPSHLVVNKVIKTPVTLKGAKNIIEGIKADDLKLYIDGKSLKKGKNEVSILCDTIKTEIDIEIDKIIIDAK